MPRLHELMNYDISSLNQCTVTLDWSAFDANCPKWIIHKAFDVLENMIDFKKMTVRTDGYEIDFTNEKAIQYKNVFEWVKFNFTNTKVMLPNSLTIRLDGCIPSGSYFT